MKKDCNKCAKYKSILCPNSELCFATDDKPYYQEQHKKYVILINDLRYEVSEDIFDTVKLVHETCTKEYSKKLKDIIYEIECLKNDFCKENKDLLLNRNLISFFNNLQIILDGSK